MARHLGQLERLQLEGDVQVRHVKAHRSEASILQLPADERRVALGNRAVDGLAKRAAARDHQGGLAPGKHAHLSNWLPA